MDHTVKPKAPSQLCKMNSDNEMAIINYFVNFKIRILRFDFEIVYLLQSIMNNLKQPRELTNAAALSVSYTHLTLPTIYSV